MKIRAGSTPVSGKKARGEPSSGDFLKIEKKSLHPVY